MDNPHREESQHCECYVQAYVCDPCFAASRRYVSELVSQANDQLYLSGLGIPGVVTFRPGQPGATDDRTLHKRDCI
jgi:hypothetical protein